ncbi:hypothetical protein Poly30_49430 [Planctomycetes bacterium Poly30]|uniref:Glycosyltransferase RgtA/B/C/D-like domain-containing protein n=2 Tax=Saltatorellus ferox TaxID=2528018 RepID=A0A518EZ68_9BACT|nr:hypothetical protein Poly30_49430 [Planctomycetes bacterium Poly30]
MAASAFAHFPFEDAYVTLRYADNLAEGRGYVFNPGEHVLGTSSPLWTLLLALSTWLGADPEVALTAASTASLVALAWLGGLALRKEDMPIASIAFATAVLFGFGRSHESWGMETPLFMALLFGVLALVRCRRIAGAGAVMGLAFLTRHEGALFALAFVPILGRHAAVRFGVSAAVVAAPWWIFAAATFGTLLPHALEAKAGDLGAWEYLCGAWALLPGDWVWSARALRVSGVEVAMRVAVLAFGSVGLWTLWKRRSPLLSLAVGAGLALLGLAIIGPAHGFRWHRWPFHLLLLALCLVGAEASSRGFTSRLRVIPVQASIAAFGLLLLPSTLHRYRSNIEATHEHRSRIEVYDEVIQRIRSAGLSGATLLTPEPGYLAYHTDNPVIDAAGLVSPEVSFGSDQRTPTILGELLQRRPGLIMARVPFHPQGYRVLLDTRFRGRLLVRADLWPDEPGAVAGR